MFVSRLGHMGLAWNLTRSRGVVALHQQILGDSQRMFRDLYKPLLFWGWIVRGLDRGSPSGAGGIFFEPLNVD